MSELSCEKSSLMTYPFFSCYVIKYPYPHHIKKSEKFVEGNMLERATLKNDY